MHRGFGNWAMVQRVLVTVVCVSWTALFVAWSALGTESPLKFHRYSLDDGLSQGSVISIVQDQQGFLWLGTQDGLNRFDGYQFKLFYREQDKPNSISSNYIPSLHEDGNGTLWVGTTNGLDKLNRDNDTFIHYTLTEETRENIGSQYIRVIRDAPNNKLWVGTYGGLFLFDPATGQSTRFVHDPADSTSLGGNSIYALLTDQQGQLWVGTDTGVDILPPGKQSFDHSISQIIKQASLTDENISQFIEDRNGLVWIATYHSGLYRYDPKTKKVNNYSHDAQNPNSLISDRIRSLLIDRYNQLWVGTSRGLNIYNPKEDNFALYVNDPSVPSSLSNSYIWEMLEDNNDSIWLGTSDGLNQFVHSTRFFGHRHNTSTSGKGLSHKRVRSLFKTKDNVLWVGVNNGLNRLDPKTGRYTYYQHDNAIASTISRGMVMSILVDSKNRVWVGTYDGGLNLLLPSGGFQHFIPEKDNPASLSNLRVYAIKEDKKGFLWLATNDGLNRFDTTNQTFERFFHQPGNINSLSFSGIYTVLPVASGDIWVGSRNGGLNRYNPSTGDFQRYEHDPKNPKSISHNRIFALYQPNAYELWVATARGLNRLDIATGTFDHFGKKQGLLNETIYAVTGDEQGFIWVSTNRGLARYNQITGRFKNFDKARGLQSNEFNNGAFFNAPDGELLFGGINGFNRFYPWQIKDNAMVPKVAVTQFYLANQFPGLAEDNPDSPLLKVINRTKYLTLNHRQPVFSFEFSALHFINPQKNRFAYLLDGFDQDWTYTHAKHRRATYTNLPAGDYVFRVKAANSDGIWGEADSPIQLTIEPAPWRTWWAYALYLLIVGGTLLAFALQRLQKLRAIKESESRLSLALWGSGNEFWDWDFKHDQLVRSNNSGDFTLPSGSGWSIDSLKGLVHPDDFEPLQQAFRTHLQGRTEYFEQAYRLRDNKNNWVWVLDRGQVVDRNAQGKPLRALGTVQNINDLKTIEAQLRQLNEALEQRVEERTSTLARTVGNLADTIEELTQTQAQLVEAEKMASLGSLVAGIAHEVNTPVGICITSTSTLMSAGEVFFQKQVNGKLTLSDFEKFKCIWLETLKLVINNLYRTDNLIQNFKLVSVTLCNTERTSINLNDLCQSVINGFTTQFTDKNATVTLSGKKNVIMTSFVSSLDLMLKHLINNSLLHGFADTDSGEIAIDIDTDETSVLLHYKDNGCGLDAVGTDQLFEPFYTTKRSEGQLGLGMHIVFNHVTQQLKGAIEIDKHQPQGLGLYVTLPLEGQSA
ncbi:MAG: PAS domain-containing protein [Algicola sp.]|nr:PAS domain-containing protein [Algicola sp.]